MAETNEGGNNEVTAEQQQDNLAKLQAEAKALESQIIAGSVAETTTPETQTQVQGTTPQTPEQKKDETNPSKPPDASNVDVPKQFKDKDGNVRLDLIEKSSEHLRNKNEEVRRSIEKFKGLQATFTRGTQELKQLEKEVQAQPTTPAVEAPSAPSAPVRSNMPVELEKKIAEDLGLEIGQVKPLLEIIEASSRHFVRQEIDPIAKEVYGSRAEREQRAFLSEVDSVAKDGNDWVLTEEGFNKIQQVFNERPYLKQSGTPVRDALRFIDDVPGKGSASSQAQVGPKTPILGGGSAVPPLSPKPTVSAAEEFENLNKELDGAIGSGDFVKQNILRNRLDELAARVFVGKV